MKKIYLSLLTCASLGFVTKAFAAEPTQVPAAQGQAATSLTFTTAQVGEIEKVVGDYLTKHPDLIVIIGFRQTLKYFERPMVNFFLAVRGLIQALLTP